MTTETRTQVLADLEAHRNTTAEVDLEFDLSIFDWMGRIKGAATEAGKLARNPNSQLQYEAWIELGSIIVGRAEQVLQLGVQQECDHDWPAELEHHAVCQNGCGLMYGEWSE